MRYIETMFQKKKKEKRQGELGVGAGERTQLKEHLTNTLKTLSLVSSVA